MIAGLNKTFHKRATRTRTTRYVDKNAQALREAMGPGYAAGVTERVVQQATKR